MIRRAMVWLVAVAAAAMSLGAWAQEAPNPHLVTYEGTGGPGAGRHIVFIAGDHEYRSEESLPALARLLARHYGFRSSVFLTTDPATGTINPGSSHIAGLEALKTADLLVIFTRFQEFPDAEMQHIVDYVDSGRPVVGFRTATHAFQIRREGSPFAKYTWNNKNPDYAGGFGRQILGETWVSHYGTNHKQSSRLVIEPSQASHPILRGVTDMWVESGGYTAHPIEGSVVLARGRILDGMTPDAKPAAGKDELPVAWTRTYRGASGREGRVFTTTHGASEDLRNEGFRRMAVNGILWAAGLESAITGTNDVSLVGPYNPTRYDFDGWVKGMKPSDMAGWEAAIPAVGREAAIPAAGRQVAFELHPGDHIAIIGNTLAERLQTDGWLETRIHARFPTHDLTFRNLAFSGDEIATRLRSKGFGTPDEWLSGKAEPIGGRTDNRLEGVETQADVIFAFFGYNESFAGEAGLPKFREDLRAWLAHTLAQRYNGESAPRIVLFSPIAHEDIGNPNLPDGSASNARLQLYARAMREEAASAGVTFVDLFSSSMGMYSGARQAGALPFTINGIHLNARGNWMLASMIDGLLFGMPAPQRDAAFLERLREAVVDKNFHWFHRYRVTDGYSTYGDRAFLTFVRGNPRNVDAKTAASTPPEDVLPSNYDTLQRELPVLDVMTRNRDERIWRIARGGPSGPAVPPVDDANTPSLVDAGTNLATADPFTSGEDAIAKMTVGDGLAVNLFASEAEFPELVNPVQMAFDTRGRLWVAVWKNYPHWRPKTPMDDKLLILEDSDGDGRADKRTVFAGDLHNPTGFEFHNGGVLVAQQPNLVFLKDTDGDDVYDEKETLLHGFDTADTHHAINSFTFDPGGALYMQEGIFHRTQVETPWAPTLRQADGGVYRFEPRTWKLETFVPMNFPNPHGHVWDHWGRNFIFDATGGQTYYGPSFSTKKYYPAMESTKAPRPGEIRVRPVGGAEILSSRHFPESMQGNLIVLNTIGFRGLLSYRFSEDGAGLKIDEADPILQSADTNFRPVDAEVGPDGALYFLDWHNPIVGHMQHNLRDRSRDRLHGRVYRVTAVGRTLLTPARIDGAPIADLLDLLKVPENRVRYRAKIELGERSTDEVIAAVRTWIAALDPSDPNYQHHLMEALWVHQWHNRVDEPLLDRMLKSPEPWARAAATRVLCYWRDRVTSPLVTLKTLAADPHPAVRLEAIRAASFFQSPEAAAVALTSLDHPQDRFLSYTLDRTMETLDGFMR